MLGTENSYHNLHESNAKQEFDPLPEPKSREKSDSFGFLPFCNSKSQPKDGLTLPPMEDTTMIAASALFEFSKQKF